MLDLKWEHTQDRYLGPVIKDDDQYEGIEYVEYDDMENSFYDSCGIHIINIYDMLTPAQIFLFRTNPDNYKYFTHRYNKNIVIKIIRNGAYDDEQERINIPCSFSSGNSCWFSSNEENVRKEICRSCGGGNF